MAKSTKLVKVEAKGDQGSFVRSRRYGGFAGRLGVHATCDQRARQKLPPTCVGWVWAAAAKPSVNESQVTWQLMVRIRNIHSRVCAWRLRA